MHPKAQTLFWKIRRALNEEDVEDLLAIGSPNDEYNGEAKSIENRIRQLPGFGEKPLDLADPLRIVEEICNERFGPFEGSKADQRQPFYNAVARKIVS